MHDPDSEAIQTQNALKLGRQKKIQVINGDELKIVSRDEPYVKDEIIEHDTKLLKTELGNQLIEGADGQHYVVLEVIQLQGGEGEQTVAVVSDGNYQSTNVNVDENCTISSDGFMKPDYGMRIHL